MMDILFKVAFLIFIPAYTYNIINYLTASSSGFDKVVIFRKAELNDKVNGSSISKLMKSATQSSVVLEDGSEFNWRWDEGAKFAKVFELSGTQAEQNAKIAEIYTKEVEKHGKGRVLALLVDQQDVRVLIEEDRFYQVKWKDEGNTILITRNAYFINSGVKFKLNRNFKIISGNKDILSVEYNLPTQDIIINFLFKNNATHWSLYGVDLLVVDSEIGKTTKHFLPLISAYPMEAPLENNLFCDVGATFSDSKMIVALGNIHVQPYLNGLDRFPKNPLSCSPPKVTLFKFLVVSGVLLTFIILVVYLLFKFVQLKDRQKEIQKMNLKVPYPQKELDSQAKHDCIKLGFKLLHLWRGSTS